MLNYPFQVRINNMHGYFNHLYREKSCSLALERLPEKCQIQMVSLKIKLEQL